MTHARISLASSRPSPNGWDFHGTSPSLLLRCDSRSLVSTLESDAGIDRQWADPMAALEWMSASFGPSAGSRWVGYLSYDLGRLFERLPTPAVDDLGLPLFIFAQYQNNHEKTFDAGSEVHRRAGSSGGKPSPSDSLRTGVVSTLPRDAYLDRVRRAIDYIRAGDVFQVNLAQRFSTALTKQPIDIWNHLLDHSPAAYGAYLDFGDHALICNSPELFLHVTPTRQIITRPIKGTRPLGLGMDTELRGSMKDQAELNMIVDLERNDLGRVCEIGSVKVSQPRTIETHPMIYHGVATVEGVLRRDVGFVDLLRATFPGGSITGAPKIRAMEIIDELERVRRGPYCGAIGYLSSDGSMQFNVAIRTMIAAGGQVHIPVGGGIVADSDPAAEYEETLVKARAMFNALGIVKI
jgi:para-aminobenzoate synthetase component 1